VHNAWNRRFVLNNGQRFYCDEALLLLTAEGSLILLNGDVNLVQTLHYELVRFDVSEGMALDLSKRRPVQ
jgi:hypothetical protein